jgi:very-short-patch-repair endonuclease
VGQRLSFARGRDRCQLADVDRAEIHGLHARDGTIVARVDLAWPELKVAVEYDGHWHGGSVGQIHADRRRLSGLVALGWRVIPVTSIRLRQDFDQLTAEIKAALRQAAA